MAGGRRATDELASHCLTAVVAGSDLMALGVVGRLREHGPDVPGDPSVVGDDDSWLMGQVQPALTTVRQDVTALSRHVAKTLLKAIAGIDDLADAVLFAPELVVRNPTTAPRA